MAVLLELLKGAEYERDRRYLTVVLSLFFPLPTPLVMKVIMLGKLAGLLLTIGTMATLLSD